ncbi:tRNA lysidine(34) synthetase TilS [Virgibacillus sp. YIM 98842]|jgi:tRNA(Ile)-lysidine synthase|uniref:tRNA lysidine(34) synthetase TilS n=1 Tax=Virgibacillus sp. YIM 98842 TaxID=2663533 RepID=UPI0013DD0CF3|nr:tRNA lysidine(34) synthetase TilS [Virgibacillus sp. YIM 98842]
MKRKLLAFIEKNQLLREQSTVLAGVSGGPDSLALLHFLASIREEWKLEVIAVTIDHRLRQGESQEDVLYVEKKCKEWGIPSVSTSLNVPAYKEKNQLGTQLAAREMRYEFFREQMKAYEADFLALGHHGDDQVETMLMEMMRAADSAALKGIPVKRKFAGGLIIRPLLAVNREEILAYCKEENIDPRFDPSNEEAVYTRNYLRKYIMPLIKEKNPNIHTTVQHLSNTLQADERYLQKQAAEMAKNVVNYDKEGKKISISVNEFKTHPYALQRRAYHLILNYLYVQLPKDLSYIHEEYFFMLLHSEKSNIRIDFPSQLKLEKSYDKLMFYFPLAFPQDRSYHRKLEIPGSVSLPDGTVIRTELVDQHKDIKKNIFICSAARIKLPLHIRTRKAGDRMTWKGLNGSKKLKDIFIDAKIPVGERDTWPLITDDDGKILWVIGLKKGQPPGGTASAPYIKIHYENGNAQEV